MFSKVQAIKCGFEKVRENPFTIFGISLTVLIYWTVPFYVIRFLLAASEIAGTLSLFFVLVVNFLILMGYIKISVDFHDGNSISLKDLIYHYPKLPDFLIGFLFYITVIAFGFVLFVFPAIFFFVRFSFFPFFLLQGDDSALSSFKKSWTITRGQFFNLLILYTLLALLNLVGLAVFFVGSAFTLPVGAVAVVYAYRKLSLQKTKREIQKIK